MTDIIGKIKKLLAQSKSERDIGNADAAKTYAEHARSLMKKHKISKRKLTEPEKFSIGGAWHCSCSAVISYDFKNVYADEVQFASLFLDRHRTQGHVLTRIK